jgi:hypothetical protein
MISRAIPCFPRIARAVAVILANGKVVAPVDVLMKMALLAPKDLEDWRFGRVPYLEHVVNPTDFANASSRAAERSSGAESVSSRPSSTSPECANTSLESRTEATPANRTSKQSLRSSSATFGTTWPRRA